MGRSKFKKGDLITGTDEAFDNWEDIGCSDEATLEVQSVDEDGDYILVVVSCPNDEDVVGDSHWLTQDEVEEYFVLKTETSSYSSKPAPKKSSNPWDDKSIWEESNRSSEVSTKSSKSSISDFTNTPWTPRVKTRKRNF